MTAPSLHLELDRGTGTLKELGYFQRTKPALMRSTLWMSTIVFAILHGQAMAQCTPSSNATASLTLTGQPGGTENRSGLAFNPVLGLYYSVNAGSPSYPLDTYNEDGSLAATVISGFDYRGVWWEPTTQHLIGNGYATLGIFDQNLQVGTGLPLGTGTVVLTSNQPDVQSIGDLDTEANEILYYFAGSIHRYSASTNALLGTYAITGMPGGVGSLNSNTVMYIGCPGKEVALYDYVNRQVQYVNKSTGAYSGSTQLPSDAPQRASFGLSYANGSVWIYDQGAWHGYDLGLSLGIASQDHMAGPILWPNPAADRVQLDWSAAHGMISLAVIDMAGREVLRRSYNASTGPLSVDVSALPAGSYTVQVQATTGRSTRPLVVAR